MSELTVKSIAELLQYKFFIPAYQRGYRWTERQVNDLLDDVWEFIVKNSKQSNEWYCLQPIVVKAQHEGYEIIDGQQRLTTIFLVLKHLERFVESDRKSFEMEYETRKNSKEFLANLHSVSANSAQENVDYFHIFQAYQKIKTWFQSKANEGYSSISSKFITPFLEETKIIWYETQGDDAIDIFTRINIGKIPLTNAELIKALFLNSSNFKDADQEKLRLKQLEIASEWDRMEYALQDDAFWYFINKEENKLSTRIEFIFNLMYSVAKKDNPGIEKKFGTDEYATFRYFSDQFKNTSEQKVSVHWKQIKDYFQTLAEWFADREQYHKIGYLIAAGIEIKNILKEKAGRTKKELRKYLDEEIGKMATCYFDELGYNKGPVRNVLLLHNIQTMLNNENETNRFPFDRYKKEKWDVEHIHAVATDVKVKKEQQKQWLENNFIQTQKHINKEYNQKIKEIQKGNAIEEKEFEPILEYVLGEEDNNIRNLCLLDRGTNRAYKNDSFKAKRGKIIEQERNGVFIPICTKNLFMKYYSEQLKDLELWNEVDKQAYLADMKETLKVYLPQQKSIK